jgi:hypothetical protein
MKQPTERGELVKLVLKYCECCGALGLRAEGQGGYCLACQQRLAGHARRGKLRTPGRRV